MYALTEFFVLNINLILSRLKCMYANGAPIVFY